MLFNSIQFWLFFLCVVIVYFFLAHKIKRNILTRVFLLAVSLFFYACWNLSYLSLILISVIVTWLSGLLMEKHPRHKRVIILSSLLINLGILFFFKYFNFFTGSINTLLSISGSGTQIPQFNVLLPVGISFYTFQALGYSIDVYRGSVRAEKNVITYALFVTFFPQLVAGPIERTGNLLPQFYTDNTFDYQRITDGLRLAAWGMFKKVVVADTVAQYVNAVYSNPQDYTAVVLVIATFFFAIQIFCDFSGYSDIAIGVARILGFRLMKNFRSPYFSASITEFWRRWHISLSSWLKDYVYIPLGGSKRGTIRNYINIFITFILSGLWHGASWNFVFWGLLHGVYQITEKATLPVRVFCLTKLGLIKQGTVVKWWQSVQILITFTLVCIGWVFFRADTFSDAVSILRTMTLFPVEVFNLVTGLVFRTISFGSGFFGKYTLAIPKITFLMQFIFIALIWFMEDISRYYSIHGAVKRSPAVLRWPLYISVVLVTVWMMIQHIESTQFIYFQF